MPAQNGEPFQQRFQGLGQCPVRLFFHLQGPHLGISIQDLRAVRCSFNIGSKVAPNRMALHVQPGIP